MRAIQDRTVLVTGANSGIGRALCEALAARGIHVVLAARSAERTAPVLEAIHAGYSHDLASFLPIDVADFQSVRRAASEFLATGRRLDVLVNNAGVAGTFGLSKDGFDLTYATNHLGPFLLTNLLLTRLQESPDARIVNVASAAHFRVSAVDWSLLERRSTPRRARFHDYAVTKFLNVVHAKELARRLSDTAVRTYALHPGTVETNIWRALPRPVHWMLHFFLLSSKQGARTPLFCATAPELRNATGRYYDDCHEAPSNPRADDPLMGAELWSPQYGGNRIALAETRSLRLANAEDFEEYFFAMDRLRFTAIAIAIYVLPAIAQQARDQPDDVIRSLVPAIYSNDVASYEKLTLPHPLRSRLTSGGRVNEDGLRELKEDPGGLQTRQARPLAFQGRPAALGPNGQYPVGTTGRYVESKDEKVLVGWFGPVEIPFVVRRAGTSWRVEPEPYFEMLLQ